MRKKIIYLSLIFTLTGLTACEIKNKKPVTPEIVQDSLTKANTNPFSAIDQSPMDMSYFPVSYPLMKMEGKAPSLPLMRIIYSRPHRKGRKIFGDDEKSLCRYGKEWRLGANEATEIEFFKDVSLKGNKLPKGRYIIYCIPYAAKWTIIINDNLFTWGLHMDKSKDILKVDVPTSEMSPAIEDFTMVFEAAGFGADLVMTWDNVKVTLPVIFSP